jgi:hypothetical protein
MEWLNVEIKLFINTKGPFNLYTINHCLKLYLLTPLMSFTLTLAALNDPPITEPPLPINVTDPPTNVLNIWPTEAKATTYGRDLVTLVKIYMEESKYSGEDNNFNCKFTIFNDLCDRVDIPQAVKIKGFLIMLRGIALDFYYKNKAIYITFDSICNAIRNYFKGLEYKCGVLIKWNAMTLKTVMIKSEGKSIEDCLQLLLNNLRHLQYGFDANLHNNDFLYNKLIVAC